MADMLTGLSARALRTRWLVRAPIVLYRTGLGFLFGRWLLMLEHVGRRTGARRYVVLEVVERPTPNQFVIVSGFGTGAQWYRNVVAYPHVRVSWWFRRLVPAQATPMSEAESARALAQYAEEHPRAWDKLRATIERATGTPVNTLPMIRLHLRSGTG